MRKLLFLGAVALCGVVSAQENSIKANPAALLGGSDLVTYERKLSDNITGVIGAGIGGFKLGGYKYESFGGGLQGRYYFDEALTGFYGAVIGDYITGKVEMNSADFGFNFGDMGADADVNSETDFSAFGGGLRAGYQWVFDSGFTLDLNGGASYKFYDYKSDTQSGEDFTTAGLKGNGILPAGSVGLGYTF
ncbi:DUF3575 domain-containing protein [Marnyiella aurantia]|uniref:DUF3575 domain-containing protein n=1 Tax=Marnyiella aurantia TaxID=2758037 RepID=A0A7D7QEU9_9FLAO|nr:DUF3575 domain-containing protein [Marnyiella aurantia]MBA5246005.1 DUF3575 domain-containing protein [Marnyiella aurantia]MBP0611694.1 DUF3575 domain-containing protein [Marnyiella aurantia]QMS98601.1 DUF3575 domain-containing protein [Marnyiella aurantia]